ncbi:MAG: hypothetical protein NZ878_01090, partial [SAR324 cluster bacterium]|nr:hypothetical protein [SAR324 cluster bacterium]
GGTLKISGTVDNSSEIAMPGTGLALSDDLDIAGTLTTGASTTINRNNKELDLSGTLIKLGGDLNLAGSVTDNATRIILQTDASLANTSSTGIGSLDLNGYALTTSTGLTINDALTLDASGEKLLTGSSDLTLNDSLVISNGTLTSTSGTLSFDSTASLGAAGTIDIQGGELQVNGNISVAGGTLTLDDSSKLKLNNGVTVTSNKALSFGTLEMNNRNLTFTASSGADLTLKKAFTLDNSSTLQMNGADLTFAETATIKGLLEPSGGELKFQKGGSVSGTVNSKNSTLALQTANLVFTGILQTNASTTMTGANWLNLSNGTLEVAGSLTLDDASTGSSTVLKINADTTITRDSPFTVGSVQLAGNTLTLGSAATDLTIDNSAPAEGESAGTFKMQEADLTWTGPVKFSTAKVYSTGGTLTLASGSSLTSTGLIDLSSGSNTGSSGGWELIAKQADVDQQLFPLASVGSFLENENDPSQSTFMSIGNLNESNYADANGKYKFKLVWGGKTVDTSGINKEVVWTQTSWLE